MSTDPLVQNKTLLPRLFFEELFHETIVLIFLYYVSTGLYLVCVSDVFESLLLVVSIVYVVLIYVMYIALILLNATLQYQMVSILVHLEIHPTEAEYHRMLER